MIKYIAICPKCEAFYKMPGLQPDWYCPHATLETTAHDCDTTHSFYEGCLPDKILWSEKILCKIMEVENGQFRKIR